MKNATATPQTPPLKTLWIRAAFGVFCLGAAPLNSYFTSNTPAVMISSFLLYEGILTGEILRESSRGVAFILGFAAFPIALAALILAAIFRPCSRVLIILSLLLLAASSVAFTAFAISSGYPNGMAYLAILAGAVLYGPSLTRLAVSSGTRT